MTMIEPKREHAKPAQIKPKVPFDRANAGYYVFMSMSGILFCGSIAAGNGELAIIAIVYAALLVAVMYGTHLYRNR